MTHKTAAKTAAVRTKVKRNAAPAAETAPTSHCHGPAWNNAWTDGEAGLSLVRQPVHPQSVRFDAAPQSIEIDIARSALLVIDMQNDFCHPEGWFGQKGVSVRPMRKPIPVIAKLLPKWRSSGGAVVWLNWGVRADRLNLSPTIQFKGKAKGIDGAPGVGYAERSALDHGLSVVPGEWGADIVEELQMAPADITVYKHRLSGFWDNELDSILRQQGFTTLLFAGVNTDRCVFSTLQDASFLGYDCVLLADACGTPSPPYVTKAIHFMVQKLFGFVATTKSLLPALCDVQARRKERP